MGTEIRNTKITYCTDLHVILKHVFAVFCLLYAYQHVCTGLTFVSAFATYSVVQLCKPRFSFGDNAISALNRTQSLLAALTQGSRCCLSLSHLCFFIVNVPIECKHVQKPKCVPSDPFSQLIAFILMLLWHGNYLCCWLRGRAAIPIPPSYLLYRTARHNSGGTLWS